MGAVVLVLAGRKGRLGRSLGVSPGSAAAAVGAGGHAFATRAQARAAVAAWIEDYNHVRRHSALGMRSPVDYERALAGRDAA